MFQSITMFVVRASDVNDVLYHFPSFCAQPDLSAPGHSIFLIVK